MSIKHIVVPMTGEENTAHVAQCGLMLAQRLKAHVTVGYEDGLGPFVAPFYDMIPGGYGAYYDTMQQLRQERRALARKSYDTAVSATKVPIVSAPVCRQASTKWLDHESGDGATVSFYGALADLVVINQPGKRSNWIDWNVFDRIVFGARRPALLVPRGTTNVAFSRPLIAWNGSGEAVMAVQRAASLFDEGTKVSVLQIGKLHPGSIPAQQVQDYLGWHCLETDVRSVAASDGSAADTILHEAKRINADCIVMGAYTHSRTRELLLGGVTEFMLEHSPLPLLLAH